ncbi:phage tail protein [Knoellia aerolata]|uniref:Uncharacterized protein n=1 Tax=Knoellia aerolata DSM 18566 TaxID=1385519 RepID=A0A0A0JYW9_9MICO|nr:hypothetical protein [Knoellia aerolata]KGN41277.1 hypothetical protein N801_08590 [Knoellia aerolata DSM 18566]
MTSAPIPALREARRRTRTPGPTPAAAPAPSAAMPRHALLALQRSAGNAAVTALLAAKGRPGGSERAELLDAAIGQARRDDPDLRVLEDGLRLAKSVGVPVDIDGADRKPPASALAVTKTGFGPAAVAPKKPTPPAKPVPPKSPLAKGGRARPATRRPGGGGAPTVKPGGGGSVAAPMANGPVDVLAPPVAPSRLRPQDDPAFKAVTGAVGGYAKAKRAHPPAASKAKEAQDAALPPANDASSQAEAAKLDTMDAQPAGSFDKKAFIAAVKAAIEAKAPKSLEQADEYKKSGQAGEVKGEVKGLVSGNKQQSAEAIETATTTPPDSSKAVAKPVAPMTPEDPGQAASIPAGGAVPKPAPAEQLNLEAGKRQATSELDEAGVSQEQLAQSNEPEFTGALAAKQEAAAHADTGPAQFRQAEAATLTQARAGADAETKTAVAGIQAAKGTALAQVTGSKAATKSKDESKRAEVAAHVQAIFAGAESEVKKILDGIDAKVDKAFEQGERGARATFEAFVEAKMSAYKRDRYGGWLGGLKWAKDKLVGMPSAVNEFFEAGRELYLKEMEGVISGVADIVATDLGAAKARIAKGKADVAAYVKTLGPDLAKVGAEAAEQVADQFGKLESDVDDKQNGLVDSLASKYVEARKGLDDRIEALQAENKGLVDKAIGAIKGVIETILKLKDMLLGVLARAAAAVGKIIKDPIGFLGNFVRAVKTGIVNFGANVLDHLKKGLQKWLFGALSEGGIELPAKFDLKGVVQLVLSILGLTWERVKARIFAKVPGLQLVWDKVIGAFEVLKILVAEGIGGLWKWVLEKAGDIKETIMGQIQEMVATQIIKAGITWLISMLNPAGAFIKACKMIYDVVMFFVEKAAQIKEFVDSVLDSVESIAAGGVGAVADKIEQTLGKLVPILIGFLASLLGLGGIADKIKKIIETVQRPVMKVVDWVVGKAVAMGKKFLGLAKRIGGKIKAGAKKLTAKVKRKLGIKEKTPEQIAKDKQDRLDKGVAAGVAAANKFAGKPVAGKLLTPVLGAIRLRYRMQSLVLVPEGNHWSVEGAINPKKKGATQAKQPQYGPAEIQAMQAWLLSSSATYSLPPFHVTSALAERILKARSVEVVERALLKATIHHRDPSKNEADIVQDARVRAYGDRPVPGAPDYARGHQWHHPEQQSGLRSAIVNYSPTDDPTLDLTEKGHHGTFKSQGQQRGKEGTPERARFLGTLGSSASAEANQQIAVLGLARRKMTEAEREALATQAVLAHQAYLFGLTPLRGAKAAIAAHDRVTKQRRAFAVAALAHARVLVP